MIADAYLNSSIPFTDTMAVLHDKFGQPHQLALRKIASVLESPDIKRGDISAFQRFAITVQSLGKARQGKFIYIAHFIHSGNSKCFT